MNQTYPMERHKYSGKWSEFDYEQEVLQTFAACQKRGTLVFQLVRDADQYEAMKPYWTIEDVAYKDEGWPINLVDAEGKQTTCEYQDLTIDWRFACDFANKKKYTLGLISKV
mgnify:CR=1 FL=1